MLNRIIHSSLNNRAVVLIVAALILMGGVWTVSRMDVDIFPDLNAPTVVVMTEAPGLAPEEVEKQVTYPIETAVNGATGVRRVRSSSTTGFSVVWVEFDWSTEVYKARQTVSERLSNIVSDLPPEAGAPMLGPQSSILGEIMIIGLTSTGDTSLEQLRTLADRTIRPRLLALGGVSQVAVIGGDVREYQILLDPNRMQYYGITVDRVLEATENMNNNTSGGVLYDYGNEFLVKGVLNTSDLDELRKTVVSADDGGAIVTLGDIATIKVGASSPRLGVASERACPAVLLTVNKQPSVGTIDLTHDIEAELESLARSLPADVHVSTDIFRQSDFIDNSISNLQMSLFEGALMVIVVLFFFLMNVRTTLISIVALPLSVIVTLIVLHMMGLNINTMSLGGIAIAIGSLVDDAIVDVENVYRRLRQNRSLPMAERRSTFDIVFEASKEVRMPIFNSSLIIIASFLPLFFLSGVGGRMLIPLGWSFIVALLASTVVALTVTPVLCYYLLGGKAADKVAGTEPWASRRLRAAYSRGLAWALSHGRTVLLSVAVLFVISLGLFLTLGRSFLPSFNEGSFTINVSTLPGISLDESDHIGREAEKLILSVPEINTVARKTGRAELDEHSLGVNVSEIEAPYTLDGRSRAEVAAEIRHKLSMLPGVNVELGQPITHRIDHMLSGTQAQIAIKIFGPDLDHLYRVGSQIKNAIADVEGIEDVNIEQQIGRPELEIRPRRDIMARMGVTNRAFADFVRVAVGGTVVSQVYEDGFPCDITVRMDESSRSGVDDIANLLIDTNQGKVPLSYVADVVSTLGPNSISRENVSRRIVVSANVEGRDLRGAVDDIRSIIDAGISLPEGYFVAYGGQFESEAEASRVLAIATLGALLIIIWLLYVEFHCWKESLIILINMPLAMIGGVLLLRITSGELNIPAIIGFIALLGIATRNGMLLISRYKALAVDGVDVDRRIVEGSADRLLPIVMTALTSALALIPLALRGSEPGNEIQSPMAVVILGGLVTSTLLNVFVVPVLYRMVFKKKS